MALEMPEQCKRNIAKGQGKNDEANKEEGRWLVGWCTPTDGQASSKPALKAETGPAPKSPVPNSMPTWALLQAEPAPERLTMK